MRSSLRLLVLVVCALLPASLLAGASVADPGASEPAGDTGRQTAVSDPAYGPPRHDLRAPGARAAQHYKYAGAIQRYRKGKRARGVSATFTVHKPKQGRWRKGDHSLGEIALARPGGNPRRPSYIEAGWIRGMGTKDARPRLFVYWWGLKGGPRCYNMRCKGFVRSGKGLRPGAVLKPGSKVRVGFVHRNNKWILRVNGKRSGYYPDRLWKGRFKRIKFAQVFGETVYVGRKKSRGRCIDMGSGRFPKNKRSARVFKIRVNGKPKPNFRRYAVTKPRQYGFKRTSRTSFRYGGPGPC